jgi:tetratricopeptide (TPR) repeat protein
LTAELATEALAEIYSQFAPRPILVSSEMPLDESEESELLAEHTPLPLSNEVAVLLEKLLNYNDQISQHVANSQDVLAKSVIANRRVGDIHYRLGDYEKAAAAYQRAIERFEKMADQSADSAGMRLELARIHNGLGMALVDQGERTGAQEAHMRALDLLSSNAESPEAQYELARTHYLLHMAVHRRDSKGPPQFSRIRDENHEDRLQTAIDLLGDLVDESPAVPDYRFLLAQCYVEKNRSTFKPGRNRSTHCDAAANEILTGLIREYPDVPDYQFVLGDTLWEQAYHNCRKAAGGRKADESLNMAESRLLEALRVTENLDIDHPNIPQYLKLKSRLHSRLADTYTSLNRHEDAVTQLRIAVRKQEQVVRASSDSYVHEVWLAKFNRDLAAALAKIGEWDEAEQLLGRQIDVLTGLADRTSAPEGPVCGMANNVLAGAKSLQAGWQMHRKTWGHRSP